ncbi:MAG: MFS transporter [Pseudomonadota bacterium]
MTTTDLSAETTTAEAQHADRRLWRVIVILAWAQSVLGAMMPVHFILGGLAGALIAPNPALATLPISIVVFFSMLSAPGLSLMMGRLGRRPGFLLAAAAGIGGLGLAGYAIEERSFTLFLIGSALIGVYMSGHNLYRFAAADIARPEVRPKAISYVMAGGLAAALIGPEVVQAFTDWREPVPYAGAYYAMMLVAALGAAPLFLLEIPRPRPAAESAPARPLRQVLGERRIQVAMVCAMLAYTLMNLVMTSTPLAMYACGFGTHEAAGVVQAHVLAMYAPSFFTGSLIARYGASRVIVAGIGFFALGGAFAVEGIELWNFYAALIALGFGWNFAFIGATAMLSDALRPEDRPRVQGINDFAVMGLVSLGSLSSGVLLAMVGWTAVQFAMVPMLTLAGGALLWLWMHEGRARA